MVYHKLFFGHTIIHGIIYGIPLFITINTINFTHFQTPRAVDVQPDVASATKERVRLPLCSRSAPPGGNWSGKSQTKDRETCLLDCFGHKLLVSMTYTPEKRTQKNWVGRWISWSKLHFFVFILRLIGCRLKEPHDQNGLSPDLTIHSCVENTFCFLCR